MDATQSPARWWDLWMRQGQHRFHATDGTSIFPDTRGTYVRGLSDLARKARARIHALMTVMPAGLDWSDWTIDIHDACGRHVVYVDFSQEGTSLDGTAHELPDPALRAEAEAACTGAAGGGAE